MEMDNEIIHLKIKTEKTNNIKCQFCDTDICVPSDLQFLTSHVICINCGYENDSMQNGDNAAPFVIMGH